MTEQFQKAVKDAHMVRALVCGLVAALVLSYVGNVAKAGHVMLGLVALAAIVGAFLNVAHARVEPEGKGLAAIAIGVVGVAAFVLLNRLF